MVNYIKIGQGNALFLLSYFGCVLSTYIVPPTLTTISNAFSSIATVEDSTLQAIAWIGLILIWVLALLVVPEAIIILGLTEQKKEDQEEINMLEVIKGFLWAFFTIIITYLARNWITTFANTIPTEYTLLLIIYWMTVVIAIISNTIIIPSYIIYKYRENQ